MVPVDVIARAFKGEPLHRVAVDHGPGLIYITTRARLPGVSTGEVQPTGFPDSDIFCFNTDTYERLRREWVDTGRTSPEVWREARRYRVT